MMNQAPPQNLYEIPNCSICLTELTENLSALDCGHIFHEGCVRRNLQYRGSCPNCQKRARQAETRKIYFPLVKNTQSTMMLKQILGSVTSQEKNQVQELFKKLESANQNNQKLSYQLKQTQEKLKKQKKQLNDTKTAFNKTKQELQALSRSIATLHQLSQNKDIEIRRLNQENFNMSIRLRELQDKIQDAQKYKKLQRKALENSQGIISYKQELENSQTSDKQMAKIFFDMIMIKNLQIVKYKTQIKSFPQRMADKQDQNVQLKLKLQKQRKQVKQLQQKQVASKKKYEDLKTKYRNLVEKYKSKCQQNISDQENYEDSMLSRPSFPLFASTNGNSKSNGNGIIPNSIRLQNIQGNENKPVKKNSSGLFHSSILEEEEIKEGSKINLNQKKIAQQSLNNFVSQKPNNQSFGGIVPKKKPEQRKDNLWNIFK